MAPAAKIHYYGAASCFDPDLLKALNKLVNQNDVQLVTNSWVIWKRPQALAWLWLTR